MATYTRASRIQAPLEDVWSFLTSIEGLLAVTPAFLHLEVEAVAGSEPDDLQVGARVELSVRPFEVGPRQRWRSHVTDRVERGDLRSFRDVMADGPFPTWEHTHTAYTVHGETVVVDRVEYTLPGGRPGRTVAPLAWPGFEAIFAHRHRRTAAVLEAR